MDDGRWVIILMMGDNNSDAGQTAWQWSFWWWTNTIVVNIRLHCAKRLAKVATNIVMVAIVALPLTLYFVGVHLLAMIQMMTMSKALKSFSFQVWNHLLPLATDTERGLKKTCLVNQGQNPVSQAVAKIVRRRLMDSQGERSKAGLNRNSPVVDVVVLLQWALRPENRFVQFAKRRTEKLSWLISVRMRPFDELWYTRAQVIAHHRHLLIFSTVILQRKMWHKYVILQRKIT